MKIQQWLLLAARCLLLALLAGAIAQPLLERAGALGQGRTLYILLDNGLSSNLREGDGASSSASLERHKEQARELLRSLASGDRAALVTLGGPATGVVLPASADASAVLRLVDEVQPTDAPTDLGGALERVASASSQDEAARTGQVVIAILSDFLEGAADLSKPLPGALRDLKGAQVLATKPRTQAPGNVQVTAVEPLRPVVLLGSGSSGRSDESGEREQVRVTLRRTGEAVAQPAVTSLRLRALGPDGAGGPGTQQAVRWQPGQAEAVVAMQIDPVARGSAAVADTPTGLGAAAVTTTLVAEIDRDALASDNVYRRPVGVREALRVGIVARPRFGAAGIDRLGPADWIRLALAPSAGTPMDVSMVDPAGLDAPVLASHDVLFLPAPELLKEEDWPRLRRFADAGGLLIVSPALEETVHLWTDAMVRELGVPWRLAREPRDIQGGASLDEQAGGSKVLTLIAPELGSLARPVRVSRVLAVEDAGSGTEVLLRLGDQTPWLIAAEPGSATDAPASVDSSASTPNTNAGTSAPSASTSAGGRGMVVYLASAPALSWTDMPAKPLMVPLMQELCRQGFGRAAGTWSSFAGRAAATPARSATLRPVASDGQTRAAELRVASSGLTAEPVRTAGLFQAFDEAGRPRGVVAINPESHAGRTGVQTLASVQSWLAAAAGDDAAAIAWIDEQSPAAALARREGGSPFALPLLIAVLALAALELFMARWFSHAVRPSSPASAPSLADEVFARSEAA